MSALCKYPCSRFASWSKAVRYTAFPWFKQMQSGNRAKKYLAAMFTLVSLSVYPSNARAIAWSDAGLAAAAPRAVVGIHEGVGASRNTIICTGTLVAFSWVLTAAHCVQDTEAGNLRVSVGFGTATKSTYTVSRYVIPKDIDSDDWRYGGLEYVFTGYDMALLNLHTPVRGVRPIPIRKVSAISAFAGKSTLYGFGLDESGELTGVVGARKVEFASGSDTSGYFPESVNSRNIGAYADRDAKATLCAYTPPFPSSIPADQGSNDDVYGHAAFGTEYSCSEYTVQVTDGGACSGDSGGPIVGELEGKRYILAVVSYGADCFLSVPTVYVKMNSFVHWAQSVMAGK